MSLFFILQNLKVEGTEQNGEFLFVRVRLCQHGKAYLLIKLIIEAFPLAEAILNILLS